MKVDGVYEDISNLDNAKVETMSSPAYTCNLLKGSYKGTWYQFTGSGDEVGLSLEADYSTFLAVYSSTNSSCDSLACVKQDASSGSLSWVSKRNVNYWILVAAKETPRGAYNLTLQATVRTSVMKLIVYH
jgi:hypothetical protein